MIDKKLTREIGTGAQTFKCLVDIYDVSCYCKKHMSDKRRFY